MTDDLDRLKQALGTAPIADPDARTRALMLAMQNFDALPQETRAAARFTDDRPNEAGFIAKVREMLKLLTTKPLLTASTSAAALAMALVFVLPPVTLQDAEFSEVAAPKLGTEGAEQSVAQTLSAEPAPAPVEPLADAMMSTAPLAAAAPEAVARMAPAGAVPMEETVMMKMEMVAEADSAYALQPDNTEAFANANPNPVKVTAEEPVSTFSIDVDTASYAIIRQSLMAGFRPDPDAVRVEEMVNYFPYAYPAPIGDQAFASQVTVMPTPWNPATRLVRIGIQGAMPAVADRPPLNLVFLIDTSGSMDEPMKLPLLRQSLALMLPDLQGQDQIAIVAYAGSAGVVLEPTKASDRATIMAALDRLSAGGGTAGAEGIELAYQLAEKMKSDGEVSRVLLATDGDFNLGVADPEGLTKLIEGQRDSGTYLSVLGFGRGNLDDATMQALAQNGNGTAAYIDTLGEARKVLGDQLTGALFPIADNVKIQVEWNPAEVAEYRLIGYETRALAREDFNNDAVDAGDIGAGVQVTALYEVTAPGSAALLNDPLRYQTESGTGVTGELGFLRLRHVPVGGTDSILTEHAITASGEADDDARFAAAIAGFGQMLRDGKYLNGWTWDQMIALATTARGEDAHGYRAEAITLMRLAQALDR